MITQSISEKFSSSLNKVVGLSLLLFSLIVMSFNYYALEQSFEQRLEHLTRIAMASLPNPTWNLDQTVMDTMVDAIFLDKDLIYISLRANDEILSEKKRSDQTGRTFEFYQSSTKYFTSSADILFEQQVIATIQIAMSKNTLFYQFYQGILSVALLALLLIFLIPNRTMKITNKFVFRPLKELENNAASIAAGNLEAVIDTSANDEIGSLAQSFDKMRQSIKNLVENLRAANRSLEEHNQTLEQRVTERTTALQKKNIALDASLKKVEEVNREIFESIHYAKLIQRSLLPDQDTVRQMLPEHLLIWQPRDIVGGDIYFIHPIQDGFVLSVIDCTGHGVPGAFMTMIVASSLRQIIHDGEHNYDPAKILSVLNFMVKASLHQDSADSESDDGLDVGICVVSPNKNQLLFAGAKLPLISMKDGKAHTILGDKHSIGYKRSDLDFQFTNHMVELNAASRFYLVTDGFIDQKGGNKGFSFGNDRFRKLLEDHEHIPLNEQRDVISASLEAYSEGYERVDDVTVLGFSVHSSEQTMQSENSTNIRSRGLQDD